MAFKPGHTTNLGKKYKTAKVGRLVKRMTREAEEKMLAELLPSDLMPTPHHVRKNKPRILTEEQKEKFRAIAANSRQFIHHQGRKKRTGSIKDKIIQELVKPGTGDALWIARRLINMAKAGDLKAIEMIMDRMDGKVATSIGGDKNNPLVIQVEPVIKQRYDKKGLT